MGRQVVNKGTIIGQRWDERQRDDDSYVAKLVKCQKCKSALCYLTEIFIVQPNLQINLEAKSMHGSS